MKSARVHKEKAEMANMFKEFVKKHEADDNVFTIKTLDFYLDSLNKLIWGDTGGLGVEIKAQKREKGEDTKNRMDRIKKFKELLGSSDQHFK